MAWERLASGASDLIRGLRSAVAQKKALNTHTALIHSFIRDREGAWGGMERGREGERERKKVGGRER